ncbi:MAG TPA: M55 family metallopeptidase [Anaerolineaceae bacterium]|nr:M55 family metallopeptidase [Anaerolineaceae bacterium]HPN50320.1 M55 family metallopeptidase [Anaerolineaceae bacterium]
MKVYISADIEGVTGVTHWDETEAGKSDYEAAREQMTAEVAAACEGALDAGATEIWVKDAHDSARNIIADRLPREARLIRGWSGHPFMMMQELDATFKAAALIGYHSRMGSAGNPLSHTMSGNVTWVKINGEPASEFKLCAYTAALTQVPLVFVSGDRGLCDEVGQFNPNITTLAVKEGVGNSTINLHPEAVVEQMRSGVARGVANAGQCLLALPDHFSVEVRFRRPERAYQFGFFPGVRQIDPCTVQLEEADFFEVMRFFVFAL